VGFYKWHENPEISEVMISDQAPQKGWLEQRPAIVTQRGEARYLNLGLDSMLERDDSKATRKHADLIYCSMDIFCLAREGVEAQRMAWICMGFLRRYRRQIIRGTALHDMGGQITMGKESPPGSLIPDPVNGLVMVQVSSPFTVRDTWLYKNLAEQVLREIDLVMSVDEMPPIGTRVFAGWQGQTEVMQELDIIDE